MLSLKSFVLIKGINRISTLLSSFQSELDDDATALQAALDSVVDYSVPGSTPMHQALYRLSQAIKSAYGVIDGYLCAQARMPIDPACYTEVIDCYAADIVLHKISTCPGQRTNQIVDDWEAAIDWLTLIGKKTICLLLNDCPGQAPDKDTGQSPGSFQYSAPDLRCAQRYTRDCRTDDCGNPVTGFRTWIKDNRPAANDCCCDDTKKDDLMGTENRQAGENIPAFKVVSLINKQLFITDPMNTLSAHSVIGITREPIVKMENGMVAIENTVDNPAWNFTSPTGMVFVALNGDLTDIPPTTGYSIDFGSIASPSAVFIDIDEVQGVA
jgi:phage gp36-like protein